MRAKTKESFDRINLTFSHAGMEFINYMTLIRPLDQQAENGDAAAETLLKIMFDFDKLIQVASNPAYFKKSSASET